MEPINIRKVTRCDNLVVTHGKNILVIDNGCDQSIISINSFVVNTFTGVLFNVGEALGSMKSTNLEIVNDAFTVTSKKGVKMVSKRCQNVKKSLDKCEKM